MDERVLAELNCTNGLVIIRDVSGSVPRWAVHNAVRSGRLVKMHPGVYADPTAVVDPIAAAAAYVDGRGAFSHTTALAVWGLRSSEPSEPVHITVPRGVRLRAGSGVITHTRVGFVMEAPYIRSRRGRWVTRVEDAVLDSWPIMPTDERIGCVVRAVNEGLTTPARLQATVARVPHIDGRGVVRDLVDRLAAGCRSHLELFGAEVVFVGAGMPEFVRQARIAVRDRVYYLDVFAEREKVDFELDGAAWHGGRHREQDLRRDAALATMGILVVRFSYRRLMTEPQRVRREILCILAERRASISEE